MLESPGRCWARMMTLGLGDKEGSPGGEERIDRAVCRPVMPAPRIAIVFWGEGEVIVSSTDYEE